MNRLDIPDFPDIEVLEGPGVYRLEFSQYEQAGTVRAALSIGAAVGAVCVVLLLLGPVGILSASVGIPWVISSVLLIGFALGFGWRSGRPPLRKRAVEIDRGKDELRIYRGGRLTIRRRLSQLDNLAIEDHPLSQNERNAVPGRMGLYQKQHCLVGYFGKGGGEKVLLLTRFEFPNERSLLQVRAAMSWAMQQRAAPVAALGPVPH